MRFIHSSTSSFVFVIAISNSAVHVDSSSNAFSSYGWSSSARR